MKKLINATDDVLSESLSGFAAAHADLVTLNLDPTFVARAGGRRPGKVALISGGGSGHEPMHAGFVGPGMLDAACPGHVFTSPTPDQMLAAAAAVDGGAGVLYIVKNYSGDVMNFEMASDMYDGMDASVVTNDDVAVEDSTFTQGRRGVAGTVVVGKIVGAAAENGADEIGLRMLKECAGDHRRSGARRRQQARLFLNHIRWSLQALSMHRPSSSKALYSSQLYEIERQNAPKCQPSSFRRSDRTSESSSLSAARSSLIRLIA